MFQSTLAFLRQLRWGDWVALGALLLLVGLTSLPLLRSHPEGRVAVVHLPDGSRVDLPLVKNQEYSFQGARGVSLLRVEDGSIRFIDSACPNRLCVQWGEIHRGGEIRVCLPNQIWVTIEAGDEGSSVDAVSR